MAENETRGTDGSGAPRVGLDPPKETGEGRTLRQEIKRIGVALRTHDRAGLGRVRGIQRGDYATAIRESPASPGRGLV